MQNSKLCDKLNIYLNNTHSWQSGGVDPRRWPHVTVHCHKTMFFQSRHALIIYLVHLMFTEFFSNQFVNASGTICPYLVKIFWEQCVLCVSIIKCNVSCWTKRSEEARPMRHLLVEVGVREWERWGQIDGVITAASPAQPSQPSQPSQSSSAQPSQPRALLYIKHGPQLLSRPPPPGLPSFCNREGWIRVN